MDNVADQIITEVMLEAEAAAHSGGASPGSGQTVVTGDSSASVQVTNVINANNSGGTSHTIIEKSVDGVVTREEEIKEFAPGEPVEVETSVQAISGGEGAPASASGESDTNPVDVNASTTADIGSSTEAGVHVTFVESFSNYIVDTVSNMIEGFLNFFK